MMTGDSPGMIYKKRDESIREKPADSKKIRLQS